MRLHSFPTRRSSDLAIEIGFDQICPYNLVLTAGLGTPWARDAAHVLAMPTTTTACKTWLAVRAHLLENGYVQTTLTNFERADIVQTARHFAYERASFDPATRDGLGFGPGAISTFTSSDRRRACKWINADTSEAFTRAMRDRDAAVTRRFDYAGVDLLLLHLKT